MSKVIHRKMVNGEWVETVIKNPPKVNWYKVRKKKKSKPKSAKPAKPKKQHKQKRTTKNDFYKSHEWAIARYQALKNSNGKCSICGRGAIDGVVLQVDHIRPFHKHSELATDQKNLQVLCAACNFGKWGDDDVEWLVQQKEWAGLTPIK